MPGVAGPGPEGFGAAPASELEERLTRALQQLRQEVEGGQQAAAQAAAAAVAAVEPVARAAQELRKETAALRGQLECLSLQLEALSLRLGLPDPSALLLASEDPEALFQGVEDEEGPEATPVAHPPAFSTRRLSLAPLSRGNSLMDAEAVVETPPMVELDVDVANGMEKSRPGKELEPQPQSKLRPEELAAIEDETVLDRMLDQTTDFEERRLIRAALRDLRQRKRDQRDREREQRLQEARARPGEGRGRTATETTTQQSQKSADGSAVRTVTKTERLVHSSDGSQTSRTTTVESSFVKRSENGGSRTLVQTKSFSSSSKKMGSIFDREDETPSRAGSLAALERRQAEKKKELMKAQSLPKTSTSQARKAMIEKMEKEGGGGGGSPAGSRGAVQRSSSFGVPNANSIKQMLLDWCRAKTRGYEA